MNEFLKELKELCEKHNAHIVANGGHDPECYDSTIIFRVRGVAGDKDQWKDTEGPRFP